MLFTQAFFSFQASVSVCILYLLFVEELKHDRRVYHIFNFPFTLNPIPIPNTVFVSTES